jgi:uracil-DNA glycosylase
MYNTRKRKLNPKEESVPQENAKRKRPAKSATTKSAPKKKTVAIVPTTTETTNSEKTLSSLITDQSWSDNLQNLFTGDNFHNIERYLNTQWSAGKTTYPPKDLIFEAFNKTPFDKVKVVLLGQDPYHDDGQVKNIF